MCMYLDIDIYQNKNYCRGFSWVASEWIGPGQVDRQSTTTTTRWIFISLENKICKFSCQIKYKRVVAIGMKPIKIEINR